jgi:hypothetical protein
MAKLYRIKPVDKKSIYAVYDVYKTDEQGNTRGFVVRELYRWGQGFREFEEPVYAEDKWIICDPGIGWGCELDDQISLDFEFDDDFTEEERDNIAKLWCNGDPDDEFERSGAAWLYDFSDWVVEEDYVQIMGPFNVDIVDGDEYNVVIEENIKLENRPKLDPNASWPFK